MDDLLIRAPESSFGELSAAAAVDPDGSDAAAPTSAAPALSSPDARSGISYVVFGKREIGDLSLLELEEGSSKGFVIAGTDPGRQLGTSGTAGDLDGDGLSDLVLTTEPNGSPHSAFVVFGKKDTSPVRLGIGEVDRNYALAFVDEGPARTLGIVASGVDANGDGLDDLLFSNESYPGAPQLAGGAHLLFAWDMRHALEGRDGILLGTSRDDEFELPPTPIVGVNGGHGTDTLRVVTPGQRLDLTGVGFYESLEVIDLRGGGPGELILNDTMVRRLPASQPSFRFALSRLLTVLGDEEDTLRFDFTGYRLRDGNGELSVYARDDAYYGLAVSKQMKK